MHCHGLYLTTDPITSDFLKWRGGCVFFFLWGEGLGFLQKIKHALTAVHRKFGEYCSILDTRSTASGGVRL